MKIIIKSNHFDGQMLELYDEKKKYLMGVIHGDNLLSQFKTEVNRMGDDDAEYVFSLELYRCPKCNQQVNKNQEHLLGCIMRED